MNAVTALAFVVAGLLLIAHRKTGPVVYGLSVVAIGVTSFLLHGIGLAASIESIAVVALAVWVIVWSVDGAARRGAWTWAGVTALLAVLLSVAPDARHVVTAGTLAVATVSLLRLRDTKIYLGLVLAAVAVGVYLLTRTGGPWCDPTSLFQGHGLWHIMISTVLWMIGNALASRRRKRLPVE